MQKLELTWLGKDKPINVEPRILLHDSSKDYGDSTTENMLIHGDNLLALKALEQEYVGKIKCIYIDPPYNTGAAFEHYDDNLEHSQWLTLMKPRLELLRNLLSDNGVMFISIDDDEAHYLKVLCDEIFGRKNFAGTFIWQKKKKPSFTHSIVGIKTEYIFIYTKNKNLVTALSIGEVSESETYPLYNAGNNISTLTFPAQTMNFTYIDTGRIESQIFSKKTSKIELMNDINIVDGFNTNPVTIKGEFRYNQKSINEQLANGDIYVVKSADFRPRRLFDKKNKKKTLHNMLTMSDLSMHTNEDATKESKALFGEQSFDYPKPEMLLSTLIESCTNENDLVLDSFLGSGTTCAVAQKMNRKWIGIEMGNHAYTHCKVRLDKVIDGSDQGGISKSVNWQGGGGYKFYELAPSLIEIDTYGNSVISKEYNSSMLVAAVAKLNGYFYAPNPDVFWKQGYSQDKSYIYVTTNYVDGAMLDNIASDLPIMEHLLICAPAFDIGLNKRYDNIYLKKIPQSILDKCEYGIENYNLNIVDIPEIDEEEQEDA